jgi:predicted ribosome quality control (RQC) complex YloA/Tae2 family protein
MDDKRELSSVDLAAVARELRGYAGAKVDKAYRYGDDLVRLKLRDFDRGRVELLLEVGDVKRAHVATPERVPDAPDRPPDFAMMLRNRLSGADLASVSQYEFDRILSLTFDRGDDSTTVVVELFGDGNVAVLDGAGEVVDCLDTVRLKSRTVAPGAPYEYPASRVNPLAIDREAFVAAMEDSTTDVVRTLATQLNFGGFWAEELCTRAGVQKALSIEDADETAYDAVYDAIRELADALETGDLDPRVYYEDGRPVDVAPVPLAERGDRPGESFDSFNAALDHYFHERRQSDEEASVEVDRPDFEGEIAKRERIIEQQEGAIEEFDEQAERERERAELLYANYDLVDEVLSTVREARSAGVPWDDIAAKLAAGAEQGIAAAEAVVDVDGADGTVTVAVEDHEVELDPGAGVEKNADHRYKEAKRVEEKKEGALAAIEDTREELEHWEERRAQWEAEGGAEEGDDAGEEDDEEADREWLSMQSVPVRSEERWYERFRWFHTSDGFLVIGGRDADDNEALVKKYLERGDRFFHAQAHGGPATVLKATGPSEPAKEVDVPEATLRQAAQFAVSYSSVWKDGRYAGDVYTVDHDQVSKTPESGEFLEKGGFAIRGDRTYFEDTPVGVAVGIQCEPETRVVGGPPTAIEGRAETTVRVEPGKFAQGDVGKRIYREFRERFTDTTLVRKVASPDRIQQFLPPGTSRIAEE